MLVVGALHTRAYGRASLGAWIPAQMHVDGWRRPSPHRVTPVGSLSFEMER